MKHTVYIRRRKAGLGSPEAWKIIKTAAVAALEAENITEPCEINVVLTDDRGIWEINRAYRAVDAPTDVLSFPFNELTEGKFDPSGCERDPESGRILLGDMALSLERARAQGAEYGHGEAHEIAYLTVHSVLHLLGYDHLDEGARKKRMRAREKAVMAGLGL